MLYALTKPSYVSQSMLRNARDDASNHKSGTGNRESCLNDNHKNKFCIKFILKLQATKIYNICTTFTISNISVATTLKTQKNKWSKL